MLPQHDLIIIGAGLSGLTLAYFLSKKGIQPTILEGSDRIGGRIQTLRGALDTPLELGATWFSDMHPNVQSLIAELRLQSYPQYASGISLFQTKSFEPPQQFYVPESEAPSHRLAGGTQMLIDTLAEKLPPGSIRPSSKVVAISEGDGRLTVTTEGDRIYHANAVVCCVPPQLVATQISFSPRLPESATGILPGVQTWMAGTIKFALEYEQPFWRHKGFSGMVYSHAGIIMEMYDHTNVEENRFGLTGFLNSGAAVYPQEVRKELVLRQLADLMGDDIPLPSTYLDKVWNDAFVLDGNPVILRPHQHNGHPALQSTYMNGRFHFCGTETSTAFPGYMEGAVLAARSVSERF